MAVEISGPMLATSQSKPFDDHEWTFEVKWDGYRCMTLVDGTQVNLLSRNGKALDKKFYPVYDALAKWNERAVLDGEMVVLDADGKSNFSALQSWRSEADGDLVYYVFDILYHNGTNLAHEPLSRRRSALDRLFKGKNSEFIKLSEQFHGTGNDLFKAAANLGLEGIIAKRKSSVYLPGRSSEWLKIKTDFRREVVVGGLTKKEDSSRLFSSLLVGAFKEGSFISVGTVGTGFSAKVQQEIVDYLTPHVTEQSPFLVEPDFNKPSRFRPAPQPARVTWVEPVLVVEISYKDAKEGALRQASLKELKFERNAKDVQLPEALGEPALVRASAAERRPQTPLKPRIKRARTTLLNPSEEVQVRCIDDHTLKFGNLSKIFWPDEGITKRDLINYYFRVAPLILPYMLNRPQSLNRFPNGITGTAFYQKDVTGKAPDWVKTYGYHSASEEREKHYLVCANEASLLYMASIGCIELNPWSSTTEHPEHPTWCIIDLDPDKNSFDQVIETARVVKKVFDQLGVTCFCKTSGSTGMHIYVPLGAKYTYEQSKEFARVIVTLVHRELPSYTTTERMIANRGGKMYLDFLQNRPQATIAGVYSLRPKKGATVSTPLHWDEVRKGLKMNDFTIKTVVERFATEGDLFSGVLGAGINLDKAMKAAQALL